MPKITGRTKYPKGWEIIEPTLTELEMKMREGIRKKERNIICAMLCYINLFFIAESDPQEGKRKEEAVWPIARINHERSRYIYEMFYKKKKISRELYNFCIKNGYADANLIAKWKKVII